MNLSLFFFASDSEDSADKYNLLQQGSVFADNNGFSGVWIPERHFNVFGGRFPNPAIAAASIATLTKKVAIRPGSIIFSLHDPVIVAENWSMIDHLSNGRVEIGVASGWVANDYVLNEAAWSVRQEKTKNNLECFLHLWQGGSITRKNGEGVDVTFKSLPKPIQKKPRIWISASGNEETFKYAGQIGASIVTNLVFQSKEKIKENINIYYDSLVSAGFKKEDGAVSLMIHTFIGDSDAEVNKVIKKPLIDYLEIFTNLLDKDKIGVNIGKSKDFLLEMAYNRFVENSGLFGSVETVKSKIKLFEDMGVTEIACLIDFGIDEKTVLDNLKNIALVR